MSSSSSSSASRAAARGTLFSVGLRLLSFICTQVTLLWVDPVALGKANIDLELAFGFILFMSREGFRLVLSKQWNLGLAYATRILHVIVAVGVWAGLMIVNKTTDDNDASFLDYRLAASLYCVAAFMEGWAEPRLLQSLFELKLEHKIAAEGMATVTKTIVTVVALWFLQDTAYPVTAFGVAQVGYAVAYNIVLMRRVPVLRKNEMKEQETDKDDKSLSWFSSVDSTLAHQVVLFTLQGLFKHALTEGDRILLVLMVSEGYDKGLYAIASAYGGMAARLMFQPLEENARLLWSKMAAHVDDASTTKDDADAKQKRKDLLLQSYTGLIKFVLYIGFIFAAFGTNYTDVLLQLVGRRPAATVLSAFCIYTLAMALNGMTEAFWYAVATTREDVGRLSLAHLLIGVVAYGGLAPWWVGRYGTVGLVAANVCGMGLRSWYALHYSAQYFQCSTVSLIWSILPHAGVLMGFVGAFLATQWSRGVFLEQESLLAEESLARSAVRNPEWLRIAGQHVAVGIASLIGVASLVVVLERPYFRSLRSLFREKQD